ncbi:MAG: HEAT repeat domain-containing protein, partial [Planctomycetes bacterium]|nr:HEAT repeat domain-containing protein [Planctomycetota bacterium]
MAEQIPGHRGTSLLLSLAKEKRDVVATTAIRGLGGRADEEARETLLTLLKSSRESVASAAAFALSRLPATEATLDALFKQAAGRTKGRVSDACALALSRMEGAAPYGDRALAMLLGRANSDNFHGLVKIAMRVGKNRRRNCSTRASPPGPTKCGRSVATSSASTGCPATRSSCCASPPPIGTGATPSPPGSPSSAPASTRWWTASASRSSPRASRATGPCSASWPTPTRNCTTSSWMPPSIRAIRCGANSPSAPCARRCRSG